MARTRTYLNFVGETEAAFLFTSLSVSGEKCMPTQEMFWGAYLGSCTDRFDTSWRVNCAT